MKQILGAFRRTSFGTVAALFLLTIVGVALPSREVKAAGLLQRSLELTSSQPSGLPAGSTNGAGGFDSAPGDAANGEQVGHKYVFQVQTAGSVGAFKVQYCTGPFGYLAFDSGGTACGAPATAPTAFDSAAATTVTVESFDNLANFTAGTVKESQNFTRDAASTTIEWIISGTALSLDSNDFVRITLDPTETVYFKNPSTTGTFFAHIETYAALANATGADSSNPPIDEGTVASSTANTISINTRVQESLKFSVEGETDTAALTIGPNTAEGASCAALTGNGAINIGDSANNNALDSARTYDGYSYFRLATNSAKGAKVLYAGEALKSSAGDVIDAMDATGETSAAGQEQFGLAIALGFVAGATNGNGENDVRLTRISNTATDNELIANANYDAGTVTFNGSNVADGDYAFDTASNGAPVPIASSNDIVKCDTGAVRYVANISPDTPAGIYSTKISYIAVPSY